MTDYIENEKYLPLFEKIDSLLPKGRLIMAIDGGSASGKTTLAAILCEKCGATVFHMDDFFLTPHMRTKERLCEVGGNVDRERFEKEVLIPLSLGQTVSYRPFDCKTRDFKELTHVIPNNPVIVEGAYSMHPQLSKYYDFSVFLDIDADRQRSRILKRNSPDGAKRFFEEWIPLENIYFEKTDIKRRCNMIIKI